MTQQQPELAVLTERVQNLITRVDVGFAEGKVRAEAAALETKTNAEVWRQQTESNRTELRGVKDELHSLTMSVQDLREEFNEHVVEDTAIQKKFGEHLNDAERHEAVADGRSQVLGSIDKLMIRGLSLAGSLLLLYEAVVKLHF